MSVFKRLAEDLKESIRAGDGERTSTLRMVLAAIKNREIEARKKDVGLSDEEILEVIRKEAKKRKDAAEEFTKGGRADLALREEREHTILLAYLPAELSDEEIKRVIDDGLRELGEAGPQALGTLMKIIMPTLKGRASGGRIMRLAKEALGG